MKRARVLLGGALAAVCVGSAVAACTGPHAAPPADRGATPGTPGATAALEASDHDHAPLATRSSAALARTPNGDALVLADEDHDAVRRIPLPLDVETPPQTLPMPGHPASVLPLHGRVLVAVRDPGFVVSLATTRDGFVELGRTAVPADAWGMAVTTDERTLLVSSAWTSTVSAVDLTSMRVRWTAVVPREPRGIAITAGGVAYVSHLVGRDITKITDLGADSPTVKLVDLPPSPLRTPFGVKLGASLGYAPVLGPDDSELYVPRHALGAQGFQTWFGAPTVDVLQTADDTPLAMGRTWSPTMENGFAHDAVISSLGDTDGAVPLTEEAFTQPRAAVYRRSTDTIVIASEGLNRLVELDARVIDPSVAQLRTYPIADFAPRPQFVDLDLVVRGGAPSAIALSADEEEAYVYARSTNDIVHVELQGGTRVEGPVGPTAFIHIADGTLSPEAEKGRRLFYDATDNIISGGLGCAGCHPEGRDDGFVWSETDVGFRGGPRRSRFTAPGDQASLGYPRQTPMLAGRVGEKGAYGWHGESASLEDRIHAGFRLHAWAGFEMEPSERERALAAYLRTGLVEPPRENRPLTDQELVGKRVFESESTGCATCHAPERGFTDRSVVALARDPELPTFKGEEDRKFKTPSLRFVGGTPPYFHDGAVKTLEELIDTNDDAMGHTSQLTREERAGLVAYLRTL